MNIPALLFGITMLTLTFSTWYAAFTYYSPTYMYQSIVPIIYDYRSLRNNILTSKGYDDIKYLTMDSYICPHNISIVDGNTHIDECHNLLDYLATRMYSMQSKLQRHHSVKISSMTSRLITEPYNAIVFDDTFIIIWSIDNNNDANIIALIVCPECMDLTINEVNMVIDQSRCCTNTIFSSLQYIL